MELCITNLHLLEAGLKGRDIPPAEKSLLAMQKVSPVSSLKSVDISSSPVLQWWLEKSQKGTRVLVVLLRSLTGTWFCRVITVDTAHR